MTSCQMSRHTFAQEPSGKSAQEQRLLARLLAQMLERFWWRPRREGKQQRFVGAWTHTCCLCCLRRFPCSSVVAFEPETRPGASLCHIQLNPSHVPRAKAGTAPYEGHKLANRVRAGFCNHPSSTSRRQDFCQPLGGSLGLLEPHPAPSVGLSATRRVNGDNGYLSSLKNCIEAWNLRRPGDAILGL